MAVSSAFDQGVRTFEFRPYTGNGAAELSDHSIAALLVGTGSYHPPGQTSFTYSFDVTSQVAALVAGGATWIGLRAWATSNPIFPNILDNAPHTRLSIDVALTTGSGYGSGNDTATACVERLVGDLDPEVARAHSTRRYRKQCMPDCPK